MAVADNASLLLRTTQNIAEKGLFHYYLLEALYLSHLIVCKLFYLISCLALGAYFFLFVFYIIQYFISI